jgi:hypothetical protein
MTLWSMDDWEYLERETVSAPNGKRWKVAQMDVLGQKGDSQMPGTLQELQYSSGRHFTLIYSESGVQRERGYTSLEEARNAYGNLLMGVIEGPSIFLILDFRRSGFSRRGSGKIAVRTLTAEWQSDRVHAATGSMTGPVYRIKTCRSCRFKHVLLAKVQGSVVR